MRAGRQLRPDSCAAGIVGGSAQAQPEVCDVGGLAWAGSTPVSLSLLFCLNWLLHGKEEFPSHKLIYGCGAETSNKIPVERWVESWSCEPEKDTEYLSGSSSQFHEQGFQQCHFFPYASRVLVMLPSHFLPFLSNWLIFSGLI